MEATKADELKGASTTVSMEELAEMQPKEVESVIEDMGEFEFDEQVYEFEDMPEVDTGLLPIYNNSKNYKDLGSYGRWTTDVYRNLKKVFKEDFAKIKSTLLDPFDRAKGSMADDILSLTEELKENVTDLGIQKKSKESKAVMAYGEKRMTYEELVGSFGKPMADNIVKADKWFRRTYDETLDYANEVRAEAKLPPIPKRENYYRHYLEMAQGVEALKNIFDSPSMIDPALAGLSEFTEPNEKWQSIKQRFTGQGQFTDDAVGGFLDYVNAISYSTHIDPQVKKFRQFTGRLTESMEGESNLNNTIEFMTEFTNTLAGKTNTFDRAVQKLIGRKAFKVVNWANSRMKSNAVVGNLSSALSQIANVPQAIATVKNPKILADGAKAYTQSIFGGGDADLYKQSDFLKERYISDAFSQFNTRLRDKPQRLAGAILEAGDLAGSQFIWSSMYRKGINDGVADPAKYADDMTREMVGGRGVGEVPILQKSKLMQIAAPFTLEVNNLWKVMSKMVGEKDATGLIILFISNFLLNEAFENIRGSGVTFDPIGAIIDGAKQGETFGDKLLESGKAIGGEVFTNLPLGSSVAAAYPEYGATIGGVQTPTRKELFGTNDPTRFGTGLPIVKALSDPLKSFVLPYGGSQVKKTYEGAKATGLIPQKIITGKDEEGNVEKTKVKMPVSVSKSGKIRTTLTPTIPKVAQALAFGGYASQEVQDFFERSGVPYGEVQTANIMTLIDNGVDMYKLDEALTEIRTTKLTKKDERYEAVNKLFTDKESEDILTTMYNYKY